jgi:hypothetical protein
MSADYLLETADLGLPFTYPADFRRIVDQGLINLSPWHIMPQALAKKRLEGVRQRYRIMYVPFARRQDNDDVACFDPARPQRIFVIHDFAPEGSQERQAFPSFWDWFRNAIDEMINFE